VDINSPDGITAGTVPTTTDLTNQRSGFACLSCAGTAANTSFRQWSFPAPALGAQILPRTYFQVVDTLPTSTPKVAALTTAAGGVLISARLSPTGTLELWNDVAGAQIGVDSTTVVAVGVWYMVQLRLLANTGAVDQAELLVMDDQPQSPSESISGTALTISDTHAARFQTGYVTAPGVTSTILVDDVAVNDSTGTTQNGLPGGGQVFVLPCSSVTAGTSWLDCAGGTTLANFPPYVDNLPPQGLADHSTAGHTGATAHQLRETVNAPGTLTFSAAPWWQTGIPVTYDTIPTVVSITAGATVNVGDNVARTRRSTSLTLQGSLTADTISLHATKTGSPTDDLIAEIQTDNGSGLPSGTVLATGTLAGTAVATTSASSAIGKSTTTKMRLDNPVPLAAGTRYHIVVRRSGAIDSVNFYSWARLAGLDYPNEAPATFDGTNWVQTGTSHTTADHVFRMTWTQPRPPLRVVSALACHGQAATGTKAGTMNTAGGVTPASGSVGFNYGNGGAATGTYPTGWWWTTATTYNVVVAAAAAISPQASVTKTSAAGTVDVCFLGYQVEVGDMSGGWGRYQKSADSTIWWGKRVFSDTLFETADVNAPLIVAAGDWALYPDPQITEGQDFPATLISVADGGGVPTGHIPA
jgi:hypothetical protein